MENDIHKKFAEARVKAFMLAPYFAPAIRKMREVFTTDLPHPTMGVTPQWNLMVHPDFVRDQPLSIVAGVIIHEVNHLLRNHAARGEGETWNIAADCEINDDIGVDLPDFGVFPHKFGFEDHKTAEEYYRLLQQRNQEEQEEQPGDGGGQGDDSEDGDQGDQSQSGDQPSNSGSAGEDGDRKCGCGGGAGNPIDKELEDRLDSENGLSEAEVDLAKKETAKKIREHIAQRGQGSVSAEWRRWADLELAPPVVPWQKLLRRVVMAGVQYARGNTQYDWTTPDRRTDALNRSIGVRAFFPGRRSPIPKVALAIDTSASMGDSEVGAALSEVEGILKVTKSRVTVMSADAKICKIGQVKNTHQAAKLIGGGGGTDFRPVFNWLESDGKGHNVLVYVTDGWGEFPREQPQGVKVVWVMVGGHTKRPPFGDVIEVEEAA